jgi:hypothetical protein
MASTLANTPPRWLLSFTLAIKLNTVYSSKVHETVC